MKTVYGTPGCPNKKCNHYMMRQIGGKHFGEQKYECELCGKKIKVIRTMPKNPIYNPPLI